MSKVAFRAGSRVLAWCRLHPLWTIWLLAVAVRGIYAAIRPEPFVLPGDSADFDATARDLLAGRGFLPNVTGIIRPPLYSLFVAASYAIGGVLALQVAQVLVASLTPVAVAVLARALRPQETSVWPPGLVAAVYPWFLLYVPGLASENLFTVLAVGSFAMILVAAGRSDRGPTIAAGVLFAAACLTRANLLITAPGIALWWLWQSKGVLRPLLFTTGLLAGLAPFSIYNWTQGNGFTVATAAGAGLNFYLGNNPEVTRQYSGHVSDEEWVTLNVGLGPAARAFLGCAPDRLCANDLPVRERDAFYYAAALRYISSEPGAWAMTELRKLVHYWRPWVEPRTYPRAAVIVSGISFALAVLMAVIGLWGMSNSTRLFVATIALTSTLAVVMTVVQLRYRFALLDPVLLAAGGAPLTALVVRLSSSQRGSPLMRGPRSKRRPLEHSSP